MADWHNGDENICESQDLIRLLRFDPVLLPHLLHKQASLLSTGSTRQRPTCLLNANYNILQRKDGWDLLSNG